MLQRTDWDCGCVKIKIAMHKGGQTGEAMFTVSNVHSQSKVIKTQIPIMRAVIKDLDSVRELCCLFKKFVDLLLFLALLLFHCSEDCLFELLLSVLSFY